MQHAPPPPPGAYPQPQPQVVYVQQVPPPQVMQMVAPVYNEKWSSGLCDCFSDCESCLCAFFCPCLQYAWNYEKTYNGMKGYAGPAALYLLIQWFAGVGCILSFMNRSEIRMKYGLMEEPCHDFIVHCFCEPCALAQEARELKARPPRPWPPVYTTLPPMVMTAPPQQQGAPQMAVYPQAGASGYAPLPGTAPQGAYYPGAQAQPVTGYPVHMQPAPSAPAYPEPNPKLG